MNPCHQSKSVGLGQVQCWDLLTTNLLIIQCSTPQYQHSTTMQQGQQKQRLFLIFGRIAMLAAILCPTLPYWASWPTLWSQYSWCFGTKTIFCWKLGKVSSALRSPGHASLQLLSSVITFAFNPGQPQCCTKQTHLFSQMTLALPITLMQPNWHFYWSR